MAISVADIDNDGDFDFTYSDDSAPEDGGTPGTNELFINQLSETGQLGFTVDHTSVPAGFSWGTVFADFDNNGFEDLLTAVANCCGGGFSLPDWLYMNTGEQFLEQAAASGIISDLSSDGRSNASADYDRDGWPDILQVYNDGSPVNLYRNQGAQLHPNRRSVTIKLVGNPNSPSPFVSSVDAIGARATLLADLDGNGTRSVIGGERQMREVASGYGAMSSTGSLELEFSMGLATNGILTVNWPSGRTTINTVNAGQHYILNETGGLRVLDIEAGTPPAEAPVLTGEFVFCAAEGDTCVLSDSTVVRYGANGVYSQRSFDAGNVACTNQVFGDPAPGVAKTCEVQEVTPPGDYTFCAVEGGVCALRGPALVRYGANGQYFERSLAGGSVACTNGGFGDPISGTAKTCEFLILSQ